ncbi:MAG: hypothetical protein IIV78_01165, partial [Oscillospiraceae bacterium]|nr:hypothetical protein [Oscillospiraceae bacterium]
PQSCTKSSTLSKTASTAATSTKTQKRNVPKGAFLFFYCQPQKRAFASGEGIARGRGLDSCGKVALSRVRGVFCHAHVAAKNDLIYLPPVGGKMGGKPRGK